MTITILKRKEVLTFTQWGQCLLLSTIISLASCGGGNSGGSENSTPAEGGTPDIDIPNETQAGIFIPGLDEINIRFPDLIIDSSGVQHAVAVDIDGNVFYANCEESCELSGSWASVVISNFEEDVVPKLQVTSNNQPRVMVLHTNSVLSSSSSWYYECNTGDCLEASAWSGQAAFSMVAVTEYDIYRSSAFTLTADDKPRASWLSTPAPLSSDDDALFYASCEADCGTTGEWTTEVAQTFNLSGATVADIVIDSLGTQHIVFLEQIIDSDDIDITYISCMSLCDSASPVWHPPVVLTTRQQDLLELLSLRLFLTPSGEPAVAVYDSLPTVDNSLTLFTCADNCNTQVGWESTIPVNLASFGGEDIVSFGHGLDATSIDNNLTLQFIAKRRNDPLSSLLYQASCSNECNSMANWLVTEVADTSTLVLEDEGICQFVGAQIGAPTKIAVQAISYELEPYWYCGSFDFIEIDDAGNRELVQSPDIRFFELATVTQLMEP